MLVYKYECWWFCEDKFLFSRRLKQDEARCPCCGDMLSLEGVFVIAGLTQRAWLLLQKITSTIRERGFMRLLLTRPGYVLDRMVGLVQTAQLTYPGTSVMGMPKLL